MATWYNLENIGATLTDGDKLLIHDLPTGTDKTVTLAQIKSIVTDGISLGTTTPLTELQVDNININLNTISTTNGNLNLTPNGTSDVVISSNLTVSGDATFNDNVIINGAITQYGTSGITLLDGTVNNGRIIVRHDSAQAIIDTSFSSTNVGDISFRTTGTERMRINRSTGDVSVTSGNLTVSGGGSFDSNTNDVLNIKSSLTTSLITIDTVSNGLSGVRLANSTNQNAWIIANRQSEGDKLYFSASPVGFTASQIVGASAMSLTQTGNLTVSGGIILGNNAVGGNVTGVTLDDYEEGTWTPALEGTTSEGSYTLTVSTAEYVKVGEKVTLYCAISVDAITTAGTGSLAISGIPFTPNALINNSITWGNYDASAYDGLGVQVTSVLDELRIIASRNTSGLVGASVSPVQVGTQFRFQISYTTNE